MYLFNVNFHLDHAYLNMGLSNYDKEDRLLNIIVATSLSSSWWFKYGWVRQTAGFGFEYSSALSPLGMSVLLSNLDEMELDTHVSYRIYKQLYLSLGAYQVNQESRQYLIGAELR